MPYSVQELEDKLLDASDKGADPETLEILRSAVKEARSASSGRVVPSPARPAGAPDRGGSTESGEPLRRAVDAVAITATAPAKGVAGIVDLARSGTRHLVSKVIPGVDTELDGGALTGRVNDLTNTIAGHEVPESIPRAAYEGLIMSPLGGSVSGAGALAGAGAGGASEWAREKGLPWWAQLAVGGAGGIAGGAAGKMPTSMAGLEEALVKGRLKNPTSGVSKERLQAGQGVAKEAADEGVTLLPSQTLSQRAPGLEKLEAQLLASKGKGGEKFRSLSEGQPQQVQDLTTRLKEMSGIQPRSLDDLADALGDTAKYATKREGQAVNQATAPLYNSQQGTAVIKPQVAHNVAAGLDAAMDKYRADAPVLAGLAAAKKELGRVLSMPNASLAEVQQAIRTVKTALPEYDAMAPAVGNRVRGLVTETIRPLEDMVGQYAPDLAKAQRMQAGLREDMSSPFADIVRQGKASGAPENAVNAAMKRPLMIAELENAQPRLLQEALQHTVNQAVDKAMGSVGGRPNPTPGAGVKQALTEGASGENFNKNLEVLFRDSSDPQAAAEGFRRVLRVVEAASRQTGDAAISSGQQAPRTAGAQFGMLAGLPAAVGLGAIGRLRDNATISILTRPDVMERLAFLASQPTPKLTQATILATVPQLFSGVNDEPQR